MIKTIFFILDDEVEDQSQFEIQGETGNAEIVLNDDDGKSTEPRNPERMLLRFIIPASQQVVTSGNYIAVVLKRLSVHFFFPLLYR